MTISSRFTPFSALAAMIVSGLLLAASDGKTETRDHRSGKDNTGPHSTEGGVSQNGQVTKATKNPGVNLNGIDKGKSNNYTIRDHR
jgi:hypothetical protein